MPKKPSSSFVIQFLFNLGYTICGRSGLLCVSILQTRLIHYRDKEFCVNQMQRHGTLMPSHSARTPSDWSEILPALLKDEPILSLEHLSNTILAVCDAIKQGHISEEEATLVVTHLIAVLVSRELDSIISGLAPRRRPSRHVGPLFLHDFPYFQHPRAVHAGSF